jgi:hypothetical protein
VPGKTTQVLAHTCGRARVGLSRDPGPTTLLADQADSDICMPEDSRMFFRRYATRCQRRSARDHRGTNTIVAEPRANSHRLGRGRCRAGRTRLGVHGRDACGTACSPTS